MASIFFPLLSWGIPTALHCAAETRIQTDTLSLPQMPSSTVLARICKHSHHTQNNCHTSSSCLLGVGFPPSPTWRQHNRTFSTQKGGGWNVYGSGKVGRGKRREEERQNSLEDSRLERAQVFEPALVFCMFALRAFTQMHAKSGWRCVTIREICICNKTGCLHRGSKVLRDPIQVRGQECENM